MGLFFTAEEFSFEPDRAFYVQAAEIKQEIGKYKDAMKFIEKALKISPKVLFCYCSNKSM